MDNAKEKVASVGLAAALAATATVGSGISASEKEVLPETSYVQNVDGEDVKLDEEVPVLATEVSDVGSASVTSYDLPSTDSFNIFGNDISNEKSESNNFTYGDSINFDSIPDTVNNVSVNIANPNAALIPEGMNNDDYDCYSLMEDAIGYSLRKYSSEHTLSDDIISTYGVSLTPEQRERYDNIMTATYDAYLDAIESYKKGDVESFRKVCNDILDKKYLNMDDLVYIISLNVNAQGNYIKDSSNYSIKDGKLIIDGYTVDDLFKCPNYIDFSDTMSLISLYENANSSDLRTLDILQVPVFVSEEASKRSNLTVMDNNSVYVYDNDKLNQKFNEIYSAYSSKTGLDRFYFEGTIDGGSVLYGYDSNNNKVIVDNAQYSSGISYFLTYLNQYRMSQNSKVGYFSGESMKEFLKTFENGIENVQIPSTYSVRRNNEYMDYSLMQDSLIYFNRYNVNHSSMSLSDVLESTYGIELSELQKARYDTLIQDTYDAYQKGISAYENGNVAEFRKISEDILVNKKYMNLDDLVDIISININTNCGTNVIKDSTNYSMVDGKLIIDGYEVESLLDNNCGNDFMNIVRLYNENCDSDFNVLGIMQVPYYILGQATNPTSLSLMVNGKVYSYDDTKLKEKFDGIYSGYCSALGLNNLGFENTYNNDLLLFGYDQVGNKQYIDSSNPYAGEVSQFLAVSNYRSSNDGRIGYFDGEFMKEYFEQFDSHELTMSK